MNWNWTNHDYNFKLDTIIAAQPDLHTQMHRNHRRSMREMFNEPINNILIIKVFSRYFLNLAGVSGYKQKFLQGKGVVFNPHQVAVSEFLVGGGGQISQQRNFTILSIILQRNKNQTCKQEYGSAMWLRVP